MKCAAAALGAALSCFAGAVQADTFSPGPLAKGHTALEGLDNCSKCHPAGGRLSPGLCLDCHTELKDRVAKGTGFHGRMEKADQRCETCHHDHQGEEFELVDWGDAGKNHFDHGKTGWPLRGKHANTSCSSCHDPRLVIAPEVKKLLAEHKGRGTFLGSAIACAGCHFDDHRGQEGNDCKRCHDEKSWKPAPAFDHNKPSMASYRLEGAHAKVSCDQCHATETDASHASAFPKPVSEVFSRFKPVEHASCAACHADPHEGRFGPRCTDCHSLNSWKELHAANEKGDDRDFHETTRYPLRGLHTTVSCAACHGSGSSARFRGVPFALCSDCHADAHQGQLVKADGKLPDCERCHSVNGFIPPKFELAEHAQTRYPLLGAHEATSCLSCHLRDAAKAAVAAPAEFRLPKARRAMAPRLSPAVFLAQGDLQRCETCHSDVHGGQFATSPGGSTCARCHLVESFSSIHFDHATTRFPLEGKHATTACESCHKAPSANAPIAWRGGVPFVCANCHTDVHAGQFGLVPDCASCHNAAAWKPAPRFVHAPPFTDWVLDGKHAVAACKTCHLEVDLGAGVRATRYKPLPRECESCHVDEHDGVLARFSR